MVMKRCEANINSVKKSNYSDDLKVDYLISISFQERFFTIEVEEEDRGLKWRHQYKAEEIETLTQRAGSPKTFTVLCKMLQNCLDKTSESLGLNIIRPDQISFLKSFHRHKSTNVSMSRGSQSQNQSKR